MSGQKFSLEILESSKITKVSETVFGLLCLAGALWFALSLRGQPSSAVSSWLAIVFLALFGVWEILSGAGVVSRYITINSDTIILKHKPYIAAITLSAANLREVKFKPLAIEFCLKEGKVITVRLGTYYSERSAEIMETVEDFCLRKSVMITGEKSEQK